MAQAYFSIPADFKHLDPELVTFLDNVGNFGYPVIGQLRDVHQTVGAGHYLDKSAEIRNFDNLAFVNGTDFRFPDKLFNHFNCSVAFLFGERCHLYRAGIVDFNAGAGFTLDAANNFAAGADDFADFIRFNLNGDNSRRKGRNFLDAVFPVLPPSCPGYASVLLWPAPGLFP